MCCVATCLRDVCRSLDCKARTVDRLRASNDKRFSALNIGKQKCIRARVRIRAEEIVKFRRVVGSDWLEYIYNV